MLRFHGPQTWKTTCNSMGSVRKENKWKSLKNCPRKNAEQLSPGEQKVWWKQCVPCASVQLFPFSTQPQPQPKQAKPHQTKWRVISKSNSYPHRFHVAAVAEEKPENLWRPRIIHLEMCRAFYLRWLFEQPCITHSRYENRSVFSPFPLSELVRSCVSKVFRVQVFWWTNF